MARAGAHGRKHSAGFRHGRHTAGRRPAGRLLQGEQGKCRPCQEACREIPHARLKQQNRIDHTEHQHRHRRGNRRHRDAEGPRLRDCALSR